MQMWEYEYKFAREISMAEFSKEFIECEDWGGRYDFCVMDEFKKLREGEAAEIICEGFGFTRIHRNNNRCYVWFPRAEKLEPIEDVILRSRLKNDSQNQD
jgi:hypothetical protein